jgi:hypothetical protein
MSYLEPLLGCVIISGCMMQMVAIGAQDFNFDCKPVKKIYTGKHNFYARIKERSIRKMKKRDKA